MFVVDGLAKGNRRRDARQRTLLYFIRGESESKNRESKASKSNIEGEKPNLDVSKASGPHGVSESSSSKVVVKGGRDVSKEVMEKQLKEKTVEEKIQPVEDKVFQEASGFKVPRIGGDPLEFLSKSPRVIRDYPRPLYLLNVQYDGDVGKALIKFLDEEESDILLYYDGYDHKPYFLVDLPPDKVYSIEKVVSHPSFDHVERVEKIDLLFNKRKVMTKIVTKDPLAVRSLRTQFPKAWEANIRYHNNYIYDLQLIPGMPYYIREGKLEAVKTEISRDFYELLNKAFQEEHEETRKLAAEWAPLFEVPAPKVKRLALDIEVYTPFKGRMPDPHKADYPVISIAFAGSDGLNRVLILVRHDSVFGKPSEDYPKNASIELFDDERSLIIEAFRIINEYPVIVTFNGDNFDITYLYNRALKLGVPRELIPVTWFRDYPSFKKGLHIDLYKFFENKSIQVYAFSGKYKDLTLDAIANALLGVSKVKLEEHIGLLNIATLATYNYRDAWLTLQLTMFDNELVWRLMILLMRISKLGLEDVVRRKVSKWIQSLFYWEHRRRNYLIPLSEDIVALKSRVVTEAIIKGKKYAGAIVINPPMGVFFNVVVLDFASLYPSIIKRWNLSYETVDPPEGACSPDKKIYVRDENGNILHEVCIEKPGLTAQITGLLRDFRVKIYKKKAKDKSLSPTERSWYDVVQRAMKVYINASYGVFGASSFPLYAPPVAESVTAIGRYTIRNTITKARELGLKVLYGDTDSLFLWHPQEELLEKLREWVSKNFELELDIDKVYKYVAFSGLKKNYVGVYPDGTVDVKGLMGKKRNTPEFLKKAFVEVLEALGSVNTPEEFEKVKESIRQKIKTIYTRLRNTQFTLDELAFKVALSKDPDKYQKTTPQHVRAARQLKAVGITILAGDIIFFVKVKGREGVKPIQLAKLHEIHVDKYLEIVKSTFEQILQALNIDWKEIAGISKLEAFFGF